MPDQWERFNARNRQLVHEDLGFEDNVDLLIPSETLQSGGAGYVTDYDVFSGNPVTAELSMPSSMPDQDEGGTTITADRIMHIRDTILDDLPAGGLTEYGESGEASVRVTTEAYGWSGIEWDSGGWGGGTPNITYEVSTWDTELNGTLRVELVEVDIRG